MSRMMNESQPCVSVDPSRVWVVAHLVFFFFGFFLPLSDGKFGTIRASM